MKSKLIIALDYNNQQDAIALVEQLEPDSCALKVGLEMFTGFGPDFVRSLVARNFKIFLDLKFHDIPNTVAKACIQAAELGVWMINLHALGGLTMMQAAREALDKCSGKSPLLIAVTVLTSMSADDLPQLGIDAELDEQVKRLALLSKKAGLDGVVCSPWEVPAIKVACGQEFLTITPGIRLAGDTKGDQKRIVSPIEAVKAGSDYLVVGRSITAAPKPALVIGEILASLEGS